MLWDHQTGLPMLQSRIGIDRVRAANWSTDKRNIISHNDREIRVRDASRGFEAEANDHQ